MIKMLANKYRCMALPARAAVWFTVCNICLKGISFISTPIFTRLISENEYGALTLYMSYEQLIMIFATWELQLGAYQKGIFKFHDSEKLFTIATQLLTNIFTIGCFTAIFVFRKVIYMYTGFTHQILLCLCIYYLTQPAYSCWLTRMRTQYKYIQAVTATLVYSFLNVVIPMIAIFTIAPTAQVKYTFTLVISIAVCLVFYLPNAQYHLLMKRCKRIKEYWIFLIKFQGPLILHSLSFLALGQADRIMIGEMVGKAQTAYYGVAYSLASVVGIVQNAINQSLLPWRYQMLEKKKYKEIGRVTNNLLLAIGLIICCFVLVAPDIMRILFTESYYEAVWCIPPVSVSIYFMFLYTVFVDVETYYEKTSYVMYVSVLCGGLNVILNYFCIQWFGYIASGYTTLASYILFAVGHYFFMNKVKKELIPDAYIFNGKTIGLISALVVLFGIGTTALYPWPMMRYSVMTIMGITLVTNRKKVLGYFRKLKEE